MTIKSISGMIIDGVAASEAIDSSGEILDVKGCDTSDLENGVGVLNYEHRGDDANGASPNDVVGKIVFCKKIFKKDDCDDKRQEFYWEKVKLPFIYIKARLYDGAGHPGAIAAAAMIRDHHANGEPILARYSIEGSTLKKEGNRLVRSMARKVALTLKPCNKSAISGLLSDPNGPNPVTEKQATKSLLQDLADTVKSEFASYEMEADPLVKDESLIKTLEAGGYDAAPSTLTQGSALQREDLGPTESLEAHRERIRNQLKAALRDYDPVEHKDTRAFLKHYLPKADDTYKDYFENLVGDVKARGLKQILATATTKMEFYQLELRRLLKATGDSGTTTHLEKERHRAIQEEGAENEAEHLDDGGELGREAVHESNIGDTPEHHKKPKCPKCGWAGQTGKNGWDYSCPDCGNAWDSLTGAAPNNNPAEDAQPEADEPAEPAEQPAGLQPDGNVVLHGINIKPGQGHTHGGQKLMILGADPKGRYLTVTPEQIKDFKPEDIKPYNVHDLLGVSNPEFLDPPTVVAERHAFAPYTFQDEQKQLVDGIDMTEDLRGKRQLDVEGVPDFRRGIVDGQWRKVLGGTELAYVKPHAGGPSGMPTNAEAEGLYHNLMHKFFGTGEHITTVGVFHSPVDGKLYHVIRRVPQGAHYEGNDKQLETLRKLHENGQLDKLLLTNSIMQNSDRHHNNYMFGNGDTTLHMIDHGFSLHGGPRMVDGGQFPHYYSAIMSKAKQQAGLTDNHELKLNPEALKWLKGLDPAKLEQLMKEHGAPDVVTAHTVERLSNMKKYIESVDSPGVMEAFAASEPDSRRFKDAKHFRETHDPVFMAAEAARKKKAREEDEAENKRMNNRDVMLENLADLREENPDMNIHNLAQMAGFDPDKRHPLVVNRGVDALAMTPDGRAQLDANIDRHVMDRVAARQRNRANDREEFVRIIAGDRRRRPIDDPKRNAPLIPFDDMTEDELKVYARKYGIKGLPDVAEFRKRFEEELRPKVEERIRREDLEEAHGMNDKRDVADLQRAYNTATRKMVSGFLRKHNFLLHGDGDGSSKQATEEDILAGLPAGDELDKFARAAGKFHGGVIPPRNGMTDEQYRPIVAQHAKDMRRAWGPNLRDIIRDRARGAHSQLKSLSRSILDYVDGGATPEKIVERLDRGLQFDEESVKVLLSHYGIQHPDVEELDQAERRPIMAQLYEKIINDPVYEKIARDRAKAKAFEAYEERQKELKERANRVKGQAKRRRTKLVGKVAEQKPVIQGKIDDPARPGTHGTPEHLRILREAVAELEAKLKTAPEQIRMFPKE